MNMRYMHVVIPSTHTDLSLHNARVPTALARQPPNTATFNKNQIKTTDPPPGCHTDGGHDAAQQTHLDENEVGDVALDLPRVAVARVVVHHVAARVRHEDFAHAEQSLRVYECVCVYVCVWSW